MSRRQEKAPEGRGPREVEARASRDIARDVEARPSRDYEEQGPTIDRGSYQPSQAPEAAYEGARPVSYQVCFLLILSLHFFGRLYLGLAVGLVSLRLWVFVIWVNVGYSDFLFPTIVSPFPATPSSNTAPISSKRHFSQ
jgi:hypothetical protein